MDNILFDGENAVRTKFDGYYCTSSGKIITVKVKGGRGKLDYSSPREHCYKLDKYGYKQYCISINGKNTYISGHKLIWITFNGEVPDNMTIDHINNIATDNRLENLQLLTREENAIKRHKRWIYSRRDTYMVEVNGEYIGILDSKQLISIYGLKIDDLNKYKKGIFTKRIRQLGMTLKKV